MLGVEIPDGVVVTLLAVSFPLVVGLIAWIVKTQIQQGNLLATLAANQSSLVDRLRDLEDSHRESRRHDERQRARDNRQHARDDRREARDERERYS